MAVPTGILWERDPHTAAKHTLLRRYMLAWFPIMAELCEDALLETIYKETHVKPLWSG
ncbi:MAG: hypothetical protein OXG52_04105 [bacterium]|nr:hypothetical protein [bacterium]